MKRKSKARQLSVFTLSFLDVMAGGFGAVVIIYLVINHATETPIETANRELLASSRLLDYQTLTGTERLAELQDLVGTLRARITETRDEIETIIEESSITKVEVETLELTSEDQSKSIDELKTEIEQQQSELTRLEQRSESMRGGQTIEIAGEGDRQYLTGLYLGGAHILIALDKSASMLDSTIVNVLRLRNMNEETQRQSPKWQRALRTTEWLAANVPLQSRLQIVVFDQDARFVENPGNWIDASDGDVIFRLISNLKQHTPANGTSFINLFELIKTLRPLPDNLFLITDGLPTLGEEERGNRTTISGRQRLSLFNRSVARLPAGIPVSVILFPLEGDPFAPAAFWNLSHITGGTLLATSPQWP